MLTQVISDIVQCKETIEKHEFDETATKQYIVIPILRSLGLARQQFAYFRSLPGRKGERRKS